MVFFNELTYMNFKHKISVRGELGMDRLDESIAFVLVIPARDDFRYFHASEPKNFEICRLRYFSLMVK